MVFIIEQIFAIITLGDTMSKLYRQPIEVRTDADGLPALFRWRNRWYRVKSCVVTRELPSLLNPRKIPRTWYRCETEEGMVCDLDRGSPGWVLWRVWD